MEPLGKIIKHGSQLSKGEQQPSHAINMEESTNTFLALKYWEEVVTAFLAGAKGQSQAVAVEDRTLVVACLSHEFAREIAELQETFIDGINKLIGTDYIQAIRLEL